MNNVISINNLNFSYNRETQILKDVSLNVKKGSIYGFLGPNGAGKTTTIRILLGLLKVKDSINILDVDNPRNNPDVFKRIGSLIEHPSVYGNLTAKENLKIICNYQGIRRKHIERVLKIVDLLKVQDRLVKQFSLGMKQRLGLAIALLPEPELLVLDEPMNGLDPNGIIEIREILKTYNKENDCTIFLSSHILSEIEKIADTLGIINLGSIIFQGNIEKLNKIKTPKLIIETDNITKTIDLLKGNYNIDSTNNQISIKQNVQQNEVSEIVKNIVASGINIFQVYKEKNDLESLFLTLTRK